MTNVISGHKLTKETIEKICLDLNFLSSSLNHSFTWFVMWPRCKVVWLNPHQIIPLLEMSNLFLMAVPTKNTQSISIPELTCRWLDLIDNQLNPLLNTDLSSCQFGSVFVSMHN